MKKEDTPSNGLQSQTRTSEPAVHAAWRAKNERKEKLQIMEQLAKSCGYGTKLIQHWGKERMTPQAVEFFEACKQFYAHELPGYFISGTVLEDWYANDWRGKKEQAPLPMQLFERALMVYDRLEKERENDTHKQAITPREINLDDLPSARSVR